MLPWLAELPSPPPLAAGATWRETDARPLMQKPQPASRHAAQVLAARLQRYWPENISSVTDGLTVFASRNEVLSSTRPAADPTADTTRSGLAKERK